MNSINIRDGKIGDVPGNVSPKNTNSSSSFSMPEGALRRIVHRRALKNQHFSSTCAHKPKHGGSIVISTVGDKTAVRDFKNTQNDVSLDRKVVIENSQPTPSTLTVEQTLPEPLYGPYLPPICHDLVVSGELPEPLGPSDSDWEWLYFLEPPFGLSVVDYCKYVVHSYLSVYVPTLSVDVSVVTETEFIPYRCGYRFKQRLRVSREHIRLLQNECTVPWNEKIISTYEYLLANKFSVEDPVYRSTVALICAQEAQFSRVRGTLAGQFGNSISVTRLNTFAPGLMPHLLCYTSGLLKSMMLTRRTLVVTSLTGCLLLGIRYPEQLWRLVFSQMAFWGNGVNGLGVRIGRLAVRHFGILALHIVKMSTTYD